MDLDLDLTARIETMGKLMEKAGTLKELRRAERKRLQSLRVLRIHELNDIMEMCKKLAPWREDAEFRRAEFKLMQKAIRLIDEIKRLDNAHI